jgi:hypothetical protein
MSWTFIILVTGGCVCAAGLVQVLRGLLGAPVGEETDEGFRVTGRRAGEDLGVNGSVRREEEAAHADRAPGIAADRDA